MHGTIEVENQGDKEVSLSLMLSRTPSANENIKPTAKGVEVDVQYTDLSGNVISIDQLQQGEEFHAKICVKKTNDSSPSMALTYAIPSGWEIWNERLIGGEESGEATYTDIRDTRISWYFALEQGGSKEFTQQPPTSQPSLCDKETPKIWSTDSSGSNDMNRLFFLRF